jgi:hypothetical protein
MSKYYTIGDDFEIKMSVFGQPKRIVKFKVQVIYQSEQVERYKLTAGTKEMILEKNLLEKKANWKVKSVNFAMEVINEATVRNLNDVFELIDFKMTGKGAFVSPQERFAHKN